MKHLFWKQPFLYFASVFLLLTGCSSTKVQVQDGPPNEVVDLRNIPDAVPAPIQVPLKNTPYELDGVRYEPMESANGYADRGIASWYGTKFHGKQTANGEIYDLYKMTAAHKTLPLPSYVKVTNLDNNRSIVVRVNDRGPFIDNRLIDLSYVAAKKLGFADIGLANVAIEGINPESFAKFARGEANDEVVYLQLAALKNYHSAQLLRRQVFSAIGARVKVVSDADEPDPFYRVRIGPVESPEHLESLLENLADAEFDPPYVVYEPVHVTENQSATPDSGSPEEEAGENAEDNAGEGGS